MREYREDNRKRYQLDLIELYTNRYKVVFTGESEDEYIIRGLAKYILDVILAGALPLQSMNCTISLTKYDWDEDYGNWKMDMFYPGTTNLVNKGGIWKIDVED